MQTISSTTAVKPSPRARVVQADVNFRVLPTDVPDRLVVGIMTTLLVVSVMFQTFVIPIGGSIAFFDVVPLYVASAVLLLTGRLTISILRLTLFVLSFGTAIVLQTTVVRESSLSSMFLALVIYAPYVGVVETSRATYMRILGLFQYAVLAICLLIFLDIAVQFVGLEMPNINDFAPASVLVQSYNYVQPMLYGWSFRKPNGFFMLEASFASQFVALGLLIEFVFFRRRSMFLAMAAALLATFAGTGIVLVLVSLPLLVKNYWRQTLLIGVITLPLAWLGAYESGWLDVMQARYDFSTTKENTSFSGRFILPYTAMWELATTGRPIDIIAGLGAGATTRTLEIAEYTSVSRAFLEYGFIFCILFTFFINYCIFSTGVPFMVAWFVFIYYNFLSGNFHLSSAVNYAFVLAAGYAIRPERVLQASGQAGLRKSPLVYDF